MFREQTKKCERPVLGRNTPSFDRVVVTEVIKIPAVECSTQICFVFLRNKAVMHCVEIIFSNKLQLLDQELATTNGTIEPALEGEEDSEEEWYGWIYIYLSHPSPPLALARACPPSCKTRPAQQCQHPYSANTHYFYVVPENV